MIFSNVASKKRSWVAHDRDLPLCFTGLTCFIFCKPTGRPESLRQFTRVNCWSDLCVLKILKHKKQIITWFDALIQNTSFVLKNNFRRKITFYSAEKSNSIVLFLKFFK